MAAANYSERKVTFLLLVHESDETKVTKNKKITVNEDFLDEKLRWHRISTHDHLTGLIAAVLFVLLASLWADQWLIMWSPTSIPVAWIYTVIGRLLLAFCACPTRPAYSLDLSLTECTAVQRWRTNAESALLWMANEQMPKQILVGGAKANYLSPFDTSGRRKMRLRPRPTPKWKPKSLGFCGSCRRWRFASRTRSPSRPSPEPKATSWGSLRQTRFSFRFFILILQSIHLPPFRDGCSCAFFANILSRFLS